MAVLALILTSAVGTESLSSLTTSCPLVLFNVSHVAANTRPFLSSNLRFNVCYGIRNLISHVKIVCELRLNRFWPSWCGSVVKRLIMN